MPEEVIMVTAHFKVTKNSDIDRDRKIDTGNLFLISTFSDFNFQVGVWSHSRQDGRFFIQ